MTSPVLIAAPEDIDSSSDNDSKVSDTENRDKPGELTPL